MTGSRRKHDDRTPLEESFAVVGREAVGGACLQARDERWKEQRRVETRVASAWGPPPQRPRCPAALERPARGDEGGADGRPPLRMRVEEPARPVRRRGRARHEMRGRRRSLVDQRLLLGSEGGLRLRVGPPVHHDGESSLADQRLDLDLDVERLDTDLGEPEAMLLDEVEAEDVATRGARRVDEDVHLDRLARRDRSWERCSQAVPPDRVPTSVEPVVRELETVLAVGTPGCRAAVLEHEPRRRPGARLLRRERPIPPERCEGIHAARV